MHALVDRYSEIMATLLPKEKRYVHYKSLYNFIIHIDDILDKTERESCEVAMDEYLNNIEENSEKIDRLIAYSLFNTYLKPLGNIYKAIGFVEMHPLEYYMLASIPIDIVVGLLFFKFPYPILTALFLINRLVKRIRHKDASKYFSIFY